MVSCKSPVIFLHSPAAKEEAGSANIFSNDGSFMSQYKALIDKQNREKQEKEAKEKKECEENKIQNESKQQAATARQEAHDGNKGVSQEQEQERGSRYQTTNTIHIIKVFINFQYFPIGCSGPYLCYLLWYYYTYN